jgi:hypothetical protein
MRFDQTLNALRQDLVEPRRGRSNCRARPQPGMGKFQHSAHSAHRYAGPRHYHSSDVPGVVGRLAASRRMSRSMVSSPTLRLSRLISSSLNAASSFWRARSAFSAPEQEPVAPLFHLGYLQPMAAGGFSCRRLTLEQADYPVLRDAWPSNAALLPVVDPLPFATSQVFSTFYYWWLNFQGVQDRGDEGSEDV